MALRGDRPGIAGALDTARQLSAWVRVSRPADTASSPASPGPVLLVRTVLASAEMLPDAAVETTTPAPLPLPSAAACTKAPLVRATRFSPRKASTPPGPEP